MFTPFWTVLSAYNNFRMMDKNMRLDTLDKLVRKAYAKLSGANVLELKKLTLEEVWKACTAMGLGSATTMLMPPCKCLSIIHIRLPTAASRSRSCEIATEGPIRP